jgi:hypothetical protein
MAVQRIVYPKATGSSPVISASSCEFIRNKKSPLTQLEEVAALEAAQYQFESDKDYFF